MTFYGASYLPPTSKGAMFDSTSFNRANEGLTYQTALDNFLAYPSAQGTENLKTTNISGLTTLTNNLIMHGAGNYIEFPDASQQTTAFIEANYAQLNTDNTFLSPYIQTFQGATAPNGSTAPFRIAGNNGEYISVYIDPTPNLDATLYSAQTTGGLTISNSGGNSFTMTPSAPNNTAYFSNPISCGSQPLTCGALSSTSVNATSGTIQTTGAVNSGTLAVTTSGTINSSNITTEGRNNTFTGQNTFNGINMNSTSITNVVNINGGVPYTTANVPPSGGNVSTNTVNPFTNTNTFSGFCGTTTTQVYPISANQFATGSYVNALITHPYTNNQIGTGSDANTFTQPVGTNYLTGSYLGSTLIQFNLVTFDINCIITTATQTILLTLTNPIGNIPLGSTSNLTGFAQNKANLQTSSFTIVISPDGKTLTFTGSNGYFKAGSSSYQLQINGFIYQSP
jgi:hypothetical protein